MTIPTKHADYVRTGRRDRLLRELDHDPYHSKLKIKDSTQCPDCGAVYVKGRWSWRKVEISEHEQRCPACQRIKDRVPAAFLTLSGDFFEKHKDEITHLVNNCIERKRAAYPLKRLMNTEYDRGQLVYTLTDAHLARSIGEAIYKAYEGDLNYQYIKEDIMLRVTWAR